MKIEVFIRNEEVFLQFIQVGKATAEHYCTAHDTFKTERTLTEESKRILEEAEQKAKELNAQLVVYDLSTFRGQLIARLRRVKSPTMRIIE